MKARARTTAPRSNRRTTTLTAPRGATTATRRRAPVGSRRAEPKLGQGRRSAKSTTDHDQIRQWVEARGGHPAVVKRTAQNRRGPGIIRIDFPGFSGAQSLKPVSWDEWFDIFEKQRLTFLYQGRTASGKPSRFNKLVARK